eukprot:jgi/Ulvmu1/10010/UM059_0059.1
MLASSFRSAQYLCRHTFAAHSSLSRHVQARYQHTSSSEAANQDAAMFCYQCEQTKSGSGCTTIGVCGKTPEVASMQDLLVYQLKGLSCWAHEGRKHGIVDADVDSFALQGLFSTLTNVNFSHTAFYNYVNESRELTQSIRSRVLEATDEPSWEWSLTAPHPAEMAPTMTVNEDDPQLALAFAHLTGILAKRKDVGNDTLSGIQELLIYGLKGLAAYAHHAERLGERDPEVYAFVHESLAFLSSRTADDPNAVLQQCLAAGRSNFRVMEMLDAGHNRKFGTPEPTEVAMTPSEGKALLVSGHDLQDLHAVLEQTEGTGVNVYTHGEMLPAHAYPGLKMFKHLKGNYGGAWYRQKVEFDKFPGAILMTTNCILDPVRTYKDRIFTTGEVGVDASQHVPGPDFSVVINKALEMPGFTEFDAAVPQRTHTVGFGHNALLSVADQILGAVKGGQLSHIFLVGGCDGNEPQRKYYQRLHTETPSDAVVITLGCGKFRILGQEWGELGDTGLPRLLDMGQCNDAYGALVVATKLAEALDTDVNSLPLSLDISWFEQKAVAVLLTLLALGVKRVRLGPKMPAFLTPEAIGLLQEQFGIMPAEVSDPAGDMKRMMANK